ncbi:MAG TPA: hypothetical protein VEB86_00575 [Chryseosolibacter sp.]|nr:hypothetical protein [Chryseosolibacter sp.]
MKGSVMSNKNIPGIHNFCDRWCERCPFTDRCAVYESEQELTEEEKDIRNQAFFDRLRENFAKAKVMLEEAAKSHGLDFNALDADVEEFGKKEEARRRAAEENIIAKLSDEYMKVAQQWLKTQPGMLAKLEKLKEEVGVGAQQTSEAKKQIETIRDSVAVIQWYSTFIYTKLIRALMGKAEDDIYESGIRDSDGSAKIALIGTERSMHAWTSLFELLPDQEDHFLNVLSLLERIRKNTLVQFPNAMNFVRPGFDEVKID